MEFSSHIASFWEREKRRRGGALGVNMSLLGNSKCGMWQIVIKVKSIGTMVGRSSNAVIGKLL